MISDRVFLVAQKMRTYLVHHHHSEQVAYGAQKQSIQVMRCPSADRVAQRIEHDLSNDKEEEAEANIAQWPPILQRIHHQQNLHDHIHRQKDGVEDI
jgi:thiamine kinase-like enzyme